MLHLFLPDDLCVTAAEKGFNEDCLAFYNMRGELKRYINPDMDWNNLESQVIKNSRITLPDTYAAPTYQQIIDWFETEHNLFLDVKGEFVSFTKKPKQRYSCFLSYTVGGTFSMWIRKKNDDIFWDDKYELLYEAIKESFNRIK